MHGKFVLDSTYPAPNSHWLALAINSSLPELEAKHLSLEDYEYNNIAITNIIEDDLKSVSFAGAVAEINFDRNNCEAVNH